jgi:hypothetical protein
MQRDACARKHETLRGKIKNTTCNILNRSQYVFSGTLGQWFCSEALVWEEGLVWEALAWEALAS